jgi:peptidoglycan/xylan/chitin deacetylase (PgdA/CDA1 family)
MATLSHKMTGHILNPFPEIIWYLPNNEKKVYFTFDDGPDPLITPEILAILKTYEVSATFFLLGEKVWQHRTELKSIDYQNHGLANHGYYHVPHILRKKDWYANNIFQTDQLLKNKFGIKSQWFRPPFGIWSPGLRGQLKKSKKNLTLWSLIAYDFKWDSAKVLVHLSRNVKSGDIIVFHDNSKSHKTIVSVLPSFIEFCQKQGFIISKLPNQPPNN